MKPPVCATCKWFTGDAFTGEGWCHYDPPKVFAGPEGCYTAQPCVSFKDFCGKHAAATHYRKGGK
jgi:hypothetical protein